MFREKQRNRAAEVEQGRLRPRWSLSLTAVLIHSKMGRLMWLAKARVRTFYRDEAGR